MLPSPLRHLVAAALLAAPLGAQHAAHRPGFAWHDSARLHYLEWPGTAPAVVLIPGYSLTAHAFDDLAPLVARGRRVIALTPRGFGESDAPASSAYTLATLVADLGAVLDTLHVDRAIIVGHSLGGSVAVRFALEAPHRVERLVLLDAFPYAQAEGSDSVDALDPVRVPPFTGDTTYDAVAAYLARYRFVPFRPALDADLRAKALEPEAGRRRQLTVGYIQDQWTATPDVAALKVPSVQLCAIPTVASEYPWLPAGSAAHRQAAHHVARAVRPLARRLCTRYARTVPGGRSIALEGSHYLFFTQPALAAHALRRALRGG